MNWSFVRWSFVRYLLVVLLGLGQIWLHVKALSGAAAWDQCGDGWFWAIISVGLFVAQLVGIFMNIRWLLFISHERWSALKEGMLTRRRVDRARFTTGVFSLKVLVVVVFVSLGLYARKVSTWLGAPLCDRRPRKVLEIALLSIQIILVVDVLVILLKTAFSMARVRRAQLPNMNASSRRSESNSNN